LKDVLKQAQIGEAVSEQRISALMENLQLAHDDGAFIASDMAHLRSILGGAAEFDIDLDLDVIAKTTAVTSLAEALFRRAAAAWVRT
jgi:hypothetical protein